ncbi:hypothetical protein JZU61_03700, partial [bacterium]|nr:hypothetical protein [bacterium]
TPDPEALAAYMPPMGQDGAQAAELPAPPTGEGAISAEVAGSDSIYTVWIKDINGGIHPQKVTVGVTDEINFEVINGLNEGDEVITTVTTTGDATQKGTTSTSFFKPPGSEKRTATTNTQRGGPPQ